MIHLQQALAHHWHFSPAAYWHLRLLCSIALGPLVGIFCLILFHKREAIRPGVSRIKRQVRSLNNQLAIRLPIRHIMN
jgi:hypothetical protein